MDVVDRKAVAPLSQRHPPPVVPQPQQHIAVAVAPIVKNPPLVGENINHNSRASCSPLRPFPPPALCSDAKNMAYAQPFPLAQQQQKVQQPQFGPDLAIRLICPDCRDPNPKLSEEFSSGDLVCQSCGLVLGDRIVDTRSEWRVSTIHPHSTHWSFNNA